MVRKVCADSKHVFLIVVEGNWHMDYNLYIILPEDDLEQVGITEIKASWGEENISYNPRRFMFENKVKMIFSRYKLISELEESIDKNEVTLKIMEGLRELEWDVNKETENLKSNDIIKLLQNICQLDKFSIYIFEDDEIIEQQIQYTNEINIILVVIDALKWKSPKNIRIFSK